MTTTTWLDAEEMRAWRGFMAASRLLLDTLDRELQRDAGMPHTYYEILVRLAEAPGRRLRMSELAEAMLSSRSRLTHAAARLQEAGLLRRVECDSDRRGAFAELTDAGAAALAAAAPGHVRSVRAHLLDALSREQVVQLADITDALLDRLDPRRVRA